MTAYDHAAVYGARPPGGEFPDTGKLRVSRDVLAAFPDLRIGVLRAHVDNSAAEDRLGALRHEAVLGLREAGLGTDDDPHIAAWQATYRAFGTNPRRSRPSAEALCRRVIRGGDLPRVNDVVDIYNVASVRTRLPCGAYDAMRLVPPVRLVHASGSESFRPIGATEEEAVREGEVVYVDRVRVLTRHWNHRDGHATRVRTDTTEVVLLCEAADARIDTDALEACLQTMADLLRTYCAGRVQYRGVLRAPARR